MMWRAAAVFAALVATSAGQELQKMDLDTGNARLHSVIPTLYQLGMMQDVSASGGDASLLFRITTLATNAGFDAVAPYHPTAVGVYSRIERRPEAERTRRNVNIAILYASYVMCVDLLPHRRAQLELILTANGLDPESESLTDLTSPIGIGYHAGVEAVKGRANDGMNQNGDYGRERFFTRFADTTDYAPVNTAYDLKNPSRWQPDIQEKGIGLYKIQQFVTPQWGLTEPYSYADPNEWQTPAPLSSFAVFRRKYKEQADEVLAASAGLTEDQKLKSEHFDNKLNSVGASLLPLFSTVAEDLGPIEFVQAEFLVNMAAHDAGVFTWNEKRRWDAVRPFSAIQRIYGDDLVEAYGGPGVGAVNVSGNGWRSYLEEADHPEYPSASTCFCHAHAQAARLYFGSDDLDFAFPYAAGSSRAEPGVTPAEDTAIHYSSWTDLASDCGESRVWAGVHFQAAVDASANICGQFGDMAFDYFTSLIDGTAPARGPSRRLPVPYFYN